MDQNIRLDEIKAFIGLLPEDQRNKVVVGLLAANQVGDDDLKREMLDALWKDVISHHVMAAEEGRFDNVILGEYECYASDN